MFKITSSCTLLYLVYSVFCIVVLSNHSINAVLMTRLSPTGSVSKYLSTLTTQSWYALKKFKRQMDKFWTTMILVSTSWWKKD